jgi:hypothetical protein
MTKLQPHPPTEMTPWLASVLMVAGVVSRCAADAKTIDPDQIEKQGEKRGAGVGTAAGGVGGPIYDLLTRDKK